MSMSLRRVTVPLETAAIETVKGAITRTLGPGRHARPWRARYQFVDLREQLLQVAPQEIFTADGVQVRLSAAVRWKVADPVAFHTKWEAPVEFLYLAAQVAVREAYAGVTVEQLQRREATVDSGQLAAAVSAAAQETGVVVSDVVIKDVILPAEVRQAAVDLATVRQRGAAQLEAARAETAALRSLANGAKLLDDHPSLARMRLVQALPPGAQLVVQVGDEQVRTD